MYVYVNVQYEIEVECFVIYIGFFIIVCLSVVSLLIKIVLCVLMIVLDVYLMFVLFDYVGCVCFGLNEMLFYFMQFFGGLIVVDSFYVCDVVLFGFVGGVVGMVKIGLVAGYLKVIGFDMGGILIDVFCFDGECFECVQDMVVVDQCFCVLMMVVYMVVVGGGFILYFDGEWVCVGLESVGVMFGLVVYGCGGLVVVIDVNVVLGCI